MFLASKGQGAQNVLKARFVPLVTEVVTTAKSGGGGGGPTGSPLCSLPPSPGPGASRGQHGAATAATAKQPQLPEALSPRGFP